MIYQQTPDFYNEYISHSAVWEGRSRYRNGEDELEHGWVKDAAAKAHKYIRRWRNKAGKWVYEYKNKKKEPEYHTTYANWNEQRDWRAEGLYGDKYHRIAARGAYLTRYRDIQNARKNAAKKGTNLTSRGYSGSKGSGESQRQRNLGTRYSTKHQANATNNPLYKDRAKDYNKYRKNPQKYAMEEVYIPTKRVIANSDSRSANKGYKRGKKKGNLTSRGYSGSQGSGSQSKKSVETTKINRNKARLVREANFVTRKRKKNKRISGVGRLTKKKSYTVAIPPRK